MNSLHKVLVFTSPEHGQANVNLATSYELALAGINVCIASFASLETRVLRLQELVARSCDTGRLDGRQPGSISFRECKGITPFLEAISRQGQDIITFQHPPRVAGALKIYSALNVLASPWSPEEYLVGIENIKEVIAAVKPDVVVIDTAFQPALDACQLVGQRPIIMLPNSIKDIAVNLQPCFAALWKYPVASSGFPFPLEWWQIPLNIYLYIQLVVRMMSSVRVKQIHALCGSLGITPRFHLEIGPGVSCICCPALPETDFPFAVIPEEMVLCGPIIMPFDSIEESDPALMKWLDNGPTVLINLGSHVVCDERLAREISSAFRILLNYHDKKGMGMQVLWKAKASDDVRKLIDDVIGEDIERGRVKVAPWLEAEPVAILQHPNMVCTVHHGGANSFFEGVWSGMPHIILPVWFDMYDYANRAEFLTIGVFGSKTSAPGVSAEELGKALVRVTGNTEEATQFRLAENRLKEICRAKGGGRKLSSTAILKEMSITT